MGDSKAPAHSALVEFEASLLLTRLASTFSRAAVDLEQQIARDLSRVGRHEEDEND
jgi:hypothetical protein